MNANVLLARCRQGAQMYGLRVEERSDAWYATWAFRIDERRVAGEGYGQNVVSALLLQDNAFPGCPHCAGDTFVKCGRCAKLTCWKSGDKSWNCRWAPCRSSGLPSGNIVGFAQHGDV